MILHVACLPFPSHQGTQAAIAAMMGAYAERGHAAHLLTYSHGSPAPDPPYTVHRVPDFPRVRSLRSGPSLGKVALDLRCVRSIRALARRYSPNAIVAHHIEAAGAALVANVAPVYYVAHTSLQDELPIYFPTALSDYVRAAGQLAERWVVARAAGVAAVAPSLASLLGERARYIPVPWPAQASTAACSRREARIELGLPTDGHVCLYAGNLDRYQGWEHLVAAIGLLRAHAPSSRLLVATESDPEGLLNAAERAGVANAIKLVPLGSGENRMLSHAASDLAWIPRRTKGGLPIKMLDAFSRGLPVVAMARATAGLALEGACTVVEDDDPAALAEGALRLLRDTARAADQRTEAHAYLGRAHDVKAHVDETIEWLKSAAPTPPTTTLDARRRQAAREHRAH